MSTATLNNNFTSVDAGIMGRNDNIDDNRAGALREARMRMQSLRGGEDQDVVADQELSLREQKLRAMREQKIREEQAARTEVRPMNSMQKSTGALLRSAWLVLIPSFGLSLIWINIHALMRMIPGLSNAFCRIGDEWLPGQIKDAASDLNKGIAMSEKAGIVFFDFVALLVMLIFTTVVIMIIDLVNKLGWFFSIFT